MNMEAGNGNGNGNENELRQYYQQQQGVGGGSNGEMVYPHSVPSAVSAQPHLHPPKRKRGRPRKYGTPELALAAKKATSKDHHSTSTSTSTPTPTPLSHASSGQGFSPHVINVVPGEDVSQKILVFMQRSKREICVLSASGSISNPSLRQPSTTGGNVTYEGQFEIISLSGSFIHNEVGGRSGGLSVCLSSTDGQVIGGVVAGQLNAAGPVQIIVGTFVIDTKKGGGFGASAAQGGDASASKLLPAVGGPISSLGFRSVDPSARNPISSRVNNDSNQSIGGGSHFMIQSRAMDMIQHADWRSGLGSYDLTGRIGGQSPENGDYDNITE